MFELALALAGESLGAWLVSSDGNAPTNDSGRNPFANLRLTTALLRAPRFHRTAVQISETAAPNNSRAIGWVERAVLDMPADGPEPPARVRAIMAEMVRRRVGGEFWAPQPAWASSVRIAVRIDGKSSFEERIAFARGLGEAHEIAVLLPRRAWSRSAAHGLERRGFSWSIGPVDPWAVLDRTAAIVVGGDDELGLLGLLAGHKLYCRSPGYIAGWGVSQDHPSLERRGERAGWQIAAAALVTGVRYIDPFNGRVTDCETIIGYLAEWRRAVDEDADLACCAGVARWKRARVRQFLAPSARGVPTYQRAKPCVIRAKREAGAIAVWPSRAPIGLESLAREAAVPLRRIEDGFVRSVGLGSDLLPPCSIVIDRRGIYYDPSQPSDLEAILSETEFSEALKDRARRLIDTLVARRLTKYNTGGTGYARPARRRVVLVPGQVEDDQSWRLGGADCTGNLDLLRRVRLHEADAFIVYKPHPDVEAGNRVGTVPDDEVLRFADQIVRDVATPALLDSVDAVHVLTSLTGFEALLRGREVVTHGQPFYSGWGVTRDLTPPPRRGRKLDLAELVAGTMILYPRYLDPATGLLCTPEVLIERLADRRPSPFAGAAAVRRIRQSVEKVFGWTANTSSLQAQLNHD